MQGKKSQLTRAVAAKLNWTCGMFPHARSSATRRRRRARDSGWRRRSPLSQPHHLTPPLPGSAPPPPTLSPPPSPLRPTLPPQLPRTGASHTDPHHLLRPPSRSFTGFAPLPPEPASRFVKELPVVRGRAGRCEYRGSPGQWRGGWREGGGRPAGQPSCGTREAGGRRWGDACVWIRCGWELGGVLGFTYEFWAKI